MKISAVIVAVATTVACIVQALPVSVDQAVIVKRGAVSAPSTKDWLENSHSKLGTYEMLERRGFFGSIFKLLPKRKPPTTLPKSETLANPIGHVGDPVGRGANTVGHALNPVGRAAGRTGAGANTVEHVTTRPVLVGPGGVKYVMPPVKVGRGDKLVPPRMNRDPGNPWPGGIPPRGSGKPPRQPFSASLKSVLGSIKGIFKKPKDPAANKLSRNVGAAKVPDEFAGMSLKRQKEELATYEAHYGSKGPEVAAMRKYIEQAEAKPVKSATKVKS